MIEIGGNWRKLNENQEPTNWHWYHWNVRKRTSKKEAKGLWGDDQIFFTAKLKEDLMGCEGAVFCCSLIKILPVNQLTVQHSARISCSDVLCLFRALTLHLLWNQKLWEATSKLCNLFLNKNGGIDVASFTVLVWKILQKRRMFYTEMFPSMTLKLLMDL